MIRRRTPDVERLRLRSRVNELFTQGRSAPDSRSITAMMQDDGEQIGPRCSALCVSWSWSASNQGRMPAKRPRSRPDIPNIFNREFDVPAPDKVWCGDTTYIWAQGKWHYLAVELDLFARRGMGWASSGKPDADSVIKALDMAYGQRGKPKGLLFHSDLGSPNIETVIFANDSGDIACVRA